MAGSFIEINGNTTEISVVFRRLQSWLRDLTPVCGDIGEFVLNRTRERFNSQTAPDGSPWAALSPGYAKRKTRNKGKILTLRGHLRGLLNYRAGPHEVRIGTPLIYGATHQFGDPRRNIPARPIFGLSRSDEQGILDILSDYTHRVLDG
jgi:phage virion morphogenesis protein